MERSPDERQTQTHGSLIDIFRQSIVCKHMVKMASRECFGKMSPMGEQDRKRGWKENLWKSSEVNTRSMSGGRNELLEELKMAAGDVISLGGRLCCKMYIPI